MLWTAMSLVLRGLHEIKSTRRPIDRPASGLENGAMERRHDFRIEADEPVTITLLQGAEASWAGRFADWSDAGMRIRLDTALEVGSLLRLEVGEELMVAEVGHCASEADGYCAEVLLWERIDKSELRRLVRESVGGPLFEVVPEPVAA
jgi:PilZ domain